MNILEQVGKLQLVQNISIDLCVPPRSLENENAVNGRVLN